MKTPVSDEAGDEHPALQADALPELVDDGQAVAGGGASRRGCTAVVLSIMLSTSLSGR